MRLPEHQHVRLPALPLAGYPADHDPAHHGLPQVLGPSFPNIREGYETKTNLLNDDCVIMLLGAGSATFNVIWNTTQTTTFVAARSATLTATAFTVTYVGNVTAGLFAGRRVKQVFVANPTEINQCLAGTGVVPFIISDVTLTIF